ncbi:MAG: hypothetical protein SPK53_06955 [Selenomonas sp.]|nr:hypothetical protein [Selenomonadales bacterium]MDD7763118.1 hypothetical protein [Selenomonadales bacterium]MDY5717470.1 hypothetical protein [Selenomonas sp.]
MSKIPKGLTDKDMMQNYVEEVSLEDKFIEAEKIADKKRREQAGIEQPAKLGQAGFTPQLTEELGKALLQLKMELYREGIKNFSYKIKRDGENIILMPKYKK